MIGPEFIEKIEKLATPTIIEVDGRPYSSKHIHPVLDPLPAPLTVSTLTGLADYLNENPDGHKLSALIVEISSHDKVMLYSVIDGQFAQRATFLIAQIELQQYPFGKYLDLESFIIAMQSRFVQDNVTEALLRLAGNVSGESVANFNDDGVTQKVLARSGIVRVEDVQVPNPVVLAPFRTFLEIDQPASKFVYRLRQANGGIECALFEADGGNWKLESIKRIRDWLRTHLPEGMVSLA